MTINPGDTVLVKAVVEEKVLTALGTIHYRVIIRNKHEAQWAKVDVHNIKEVLGVEVAPSNQV